MLPMEDSKDLIRYLIAEGTKMEGIMDTFLTVPHYTSAILEEHPGLKAMFSQTVFDMVHEVLQEPTEPLIAA